MAIRDLQITRVNGASGAVDTSVTASVESSPAAPTHPPISIPVPPTAAQWQSFVQAGKGGLSTDPQSGSILKILAENGFAEKIKNGASSGHTYNVWHTPPSVEFVLVDSWTDQWGALKKHYEFFKITDVAQTVQNSDEPDMSVPEHPIIVALRDIEHDVDQLLALTAKLS